MSIFDQIMMHQREAVIKSKSQVTEYLNKFLAIEHGLKVGDFIERNDFGSNVYKFPAGNQIAKVVKVYDDIEFDNERHFNGVIIVVHEDGDISYHKIDLRCYKKIKAQKGKNIFSLKRGK